MHLIQLFKELSLQPQSTQELRGLILDLAIRGRLTKEWREEHPEVESAEVLLENIRAEKAELVKEKKLRKEKPLPALANEDIALDIPNTWVYTRLGEIGDWGAGATPKRSNPDFYNGHINWFKSGELNNGTITYGSTEKITELAVEKSSVRLNQPGDILIAMYGATIGKTAKLEVPGTTNQAVCACTCFGGMFNDFLHLLLKALKSVFTNQGEGGAQPNISRVKIRNQVFPLPPLAEQKAIVEVVDQLLAEVDALEEQLQQRVQLKEDYVTAALRQLTAQAPAPAWAALEPHFKSAFDNSGSVDQLRQAILQLAVQGKLTAPWRRAHADTEPASVLLKQIQAEKVRLVQEKKIKKQKELPPIAEEEVPFVLPEGWVWCRLGEVVELISGQHIKSSDYNDKENGVPYLTGPSDFGDKNPIFTKWTPTPKVLALKNDILVTVKGSGVGKINLLDSDDVAIGRQLMAIRSIGLLLEFIYIFLDSDYQNMQDQKVGIAIPGIGRDDILHKTFPLPPLTEQKAIVQIVDDLLAACDDLQAGLGQREDLLGDLMRASVREVRN